MSMPHLPHARMFRPDDFSLTKVSVVSPPQRGQRPFKASNTKDFNVSCNGADLACSIQFELIDKSDTFNTVTSQKFQCASCGEVYEIHVRILQDGNKPDQMNTEIILVRL